MKSYKIILNSGPDEFGGEGTFEAARILHELADKVALECRHNTPLFDRHGRSVGIVKRSNRPYKTA